MNVEIGIETPIFLFWEYLFRNFGILSLQCCWFLQSCCYWRFCCCWSTVVDIPSVPGVYTIVYIPSVVDVSTVTRVPSFILAFMLLTFCGLAVFKSHLFLELPPLLVSLLWLAPLVF
jgi:hypothetical protein